MAYNGLGVSNAVLREAQVPNGNAHVWSFTADPKIGLEPYHGVNTYLIGAAVGAVVLGSSSDWDRARQCEIVYGGQV